MFVCTNQVRVNYIDDIHNCSRSFLKTRGFTLTALLSNCFTRDVNQGRSSGSYNSFNYYLNTKN